MGVPTIHNDTIEVWTTPTARAARRVLEVADYFPGGAGGTITCTWYVFKGTLPQWITTMSVVTREKE